MDAKIDFNMGHWNTEPSFSRIYWFGLGEVMFNSSAGWRALTPTCPTAQQLQCQHAENVRKMSPNWHICLILELHTVIFNSPILYSWQFTITSCACLGTPIVSWISTLGQIRYLVLRWWVASPDSSTALSSRVTTKCAAARQICGKCKVAAAAAGGCGARLFPGPPIWVAAGLCHWFCWGKKAHLPPRSWMALNKLCPSASGKLIVAILGASRTMTRGKLMVLSSGENI